jgi:hypothetical protein
MNTIRRISFQPHTSGTSNNRPLSRSWQSQCAQSSTMIEDGRAHLRFSRSWRRGAPFFETQSVHYRVWFEEWILADEDEPPVDDDVGRDYFFSYRSTSWSAGLAFSAPMDAVARVRWNLQILFEELERKFSYLFPIINFDPERDSIYQYLRSPFSDYSYHCGAHKIRRYFNWLASMAGAEQWKNPDDVTFNRGQLQMLDRVLQRR